MRAFLLGASLAAMLAGCAQQGELRITAVGGQETRADDGALAKAHILLSRGEQALAVDAYRKAIRHNPGNASAYNGLAIAYDQLGRHDLSRRYYELALAYAPREAKYYRNLARSLERQGLKNEAARILAQMNAASDAPALAPRQPSLRSLAQIASEKAAALAVAATGVIRPHLERLSMGEVLLETRAQPAPVTAAHSITVPIPVAVTPVEEPEIAARPVGHSITVEIPDPVPDAPEALAEAQSVKPAAAMPQDKMVAIRQTEDDRSARHAIPSDIALASLTSTAPLEPAVAAPQQLLAAAAADPQALLAIALRPAQDGPPSCDATARPAWVSEYDLAASGARMTVFTGDFAPMRLGGSGLAIDLPLLYRASRNLPVAAEAMTISAPCTVRMADAPPAYDSLFSSLWLDWTDEDSAA